MCEKEKERGEDERPEMVREIIEETVRDEGSLEEIGREIEGRRKRREDHGRGRRNQLGVWRLLGEKGFKGVGGG